MDNQTRKVLDRSINRWADSKPLPDALSRVLDLALEYYASAEYNAKYAGIKHSVDDSISIVAVTKFYKSITQKEYKKD